MVNIFLGLTLGTDFVILGGTIGELKNDAALFSNSAKAFMLKLEAMFLIAYLVSASLGI